MKKVSELKLGDKIEIKPENQSFQTSVSGSVTDDNARNYAKKILIKYIQSERLQYKQKQGDYSIDELLTELEK
jgi:nicotinate-nucleotide pyrophosphorylase